MKSLRFGILVLCFVTGLYGSDMEIETLRCEYAVNPLGIDSVQPRLSWIIQSHERGQNQTAYHLIVASSQESLAEGKGDLWDSGKVQSSQSIQVDYAGKPLVSNQCCYWMVRVWDNDNQPSSWSRPAMWIMGLLTPLDWQAEWITNSHSKPIEQSKGLPIFRQEFEVASPLQRALVHVCGLGQYELFLNGQKVGRRFLDPAWSMYEKTVFYTTYDITGLLRSGRNAFGVMLGKGFYSTAGDRRVHGTHSKRPLKLILQVHLEYNNGTTASIVSDRTWKTTAGPISHCAILGGSDYDARSLPLDWAEPGFDDATWSTVVQANPNQGTLVASNMPPMQTFDVFKPVCIDQPEPGVYVYNFGQNASAVPRLTVQGKAGQVLRLSPAEQRHGQTDRTNDGRGRVNQAGVGKPNYWQYTLNGKGQESWSPQFTYSGYQYLELTGAVPRGEPNPHGLPVVDDLVSLHVRNASLPAGAFECSNALLNKIDQLIDWAVRSNMGHVLTDCPHREKLGWLEVSYLMEPSIAFSYDIARFYTKKSRDIRDSQDPSGKIYTVAPNYPQFSGGFRYTPEWGAAGVVLPWQIYLRYGDRRVLTDNYDMMKRFVDYMRDTSTDLIAQPGLGDWYDYGHGQPVGASRFTPTALSATATFYRCANIVALTAKQLNNKADHAIYTALAIRIKQTFNAAYFNGRDAYQHAGSPQTANAMALVLGLVPSDRISAVVECMVADIQSRGNQQTAGDIGFAYLVEALAQQGRSDVLFDITNRHDIGSYGFILDRAWTSMPEAWDASTSASMNHCMLGHIRQWFYRQVAGIQNDPTDIGFKKILIRPEPVGHLTWAKASYQSPYGRIVVQWKRHKGQFFLDVTIPVNTTATIYIPTQNPDAVTESGKPWNQVKGFEGMGRNKHRAVLHVESGQYCFASPFKTEQQ